MRLAYTGRAIVHGAESFSEEIGQEGTRQESCGQPRGGQKAGAGPQDGPEAGIQTRNQDREEGRRHGGRAQGDGSREGGQEGKAPSLSKQELQYFRNLLLEKRREIIGDVGSMESEAFKGGSNLSNMPIHMADVGTDNFEQEFTLGLIESERQILRDIQEALVRIDNGTFGICLGTGKAIPKVRLEAVPWAKYTIEYSRLLESGKIERDNGQPAEEEAAVGGGEDDEE